MAVTIYDVARTAGVGVGTVSRVLNNSQSVKASTRQRVLEAISGLNYTPDPIARSMGKGRTGSLGVIVPFFTRPFQLEVLRGIEAATGRLGQELVIYNIETEEQRTHYFSRLPMRRKVDGLLLVSLRLEDEMLPSFHEANLPVVLLDAYSPIITSIVVTNVDGAYHAVKFLLEKGHRRIGFINGIIEGNFKFNQANDRLIGVHRAYGEAGIEFDPELMGTSTWSRQGGMEVARQLLALPDPPTAIFAGSDLQALGALEAARALGIAVPDQLSIMGFDGIELSELLEMTTMQQPMRQMGELGVERLMAHLDDPLLPAELRRLDTVLIERKTTGPVRD